MTSQSIPALLATLPFVGIIAATAFYLQGDFSSPHRASPATSATAGEIPVSAASPRLAPNHPRVLEPSSEPAAAVLAVRSRPSLAPASGRLQPPPINAAAPAGALAEHSSDTLPPEAVNMPHAAGSNAHDLLEVSTRSTSALQASAESGPRLSQQALAAAAAPTAAPRAPVGRPVVKTLPLPLALQDIDPVAMGLSVPQVKILESLREDFVKQIGGQWQNPYDPAYAARWQKAQPANNAELRLFFGSAFAQKIELEAAQAAYAASRSR